VRSTSIDVGYSWSGTVNDPDVTPAWLKIAACRWHCAGQWSRSACHRSAEAGSGVPSGAVALPENASWLPTTDRVPATGVLITGTGTVGVPTVTDVWATSDSPAWSVALTRTTLTPVLVYTWVTPVPVASSNAPSLSRSQAKVRVSPGSGSVDALAS
jgi:hypothetical protein